MAEITEAIVAILKAHSGLSALVSGRIFADSVPQGAIYPAVSYQRVSPGPRSSAMGKDSGLVRPRYQLTAWAQEPNARSAADAVATQIRLALQRTSGTFAGVEVQEIFIEGDTALHEPGTQVKGTAVDALVWAREVVA